MIMHPGVCWEFMMLWLSVEMLVAGKGMVEATGLRLWLSRNWSFGLFLQQQLARMLSGTQTLCSSLQ